MDKQLGIGIQAKLDTSRVQQDVKKLDKQLKDAGRGKIDPISDSAVKKVEKVVSAFETYLKLDREMARRLRVTGQEGKGPESVNWDVVYQNSRHRQAKMRQLQSFMHGAGDGAAPGAVQSGGGGLGGMAVGAAQAGLRASGPAGGVAAGALGTGMSSGFGAGMGALFGGLLALGVGKIVGAVSEKVGQSNDNNIAYDRLKRTLGDVNVSFDALKAVVTSAGDGLKITYAEAGQLATQFAKLGNVSGDQYKAIKDELDTGVGMSRAFGLDPSQGVGVLGQMRGVRQTGDAQESRRFALLIGEAIGRSGAFAKADEVMEAIAGFATSQTRASLGRANVEGYAGAYSSLVGSGIPGLDPAGAGALLARVNASLTAGGAKGEASQFFTNMLGSRLGLDPFQSQMWREGGAFETLNGAFGKDSIAARMGIGMPSGVDGDKTLLQYQLEELKSKYGHMGPGMLMNAASSHLGVSMRQAGALLKIDPNQMGEMLKYGDISKLSASGIGNMGKALYGSSEDRRALASSLLGRKDVSGADKSRISDAMGDDQALRPVLAELTAQYEQERTTGSDIRDSKNALDNILVTLADKIAPAMNAMRMGIVMMAGGGKKSENELMADYEKLGLGDTKKAIQGRFAAERAKIFEDAKAKKESKAVTDAKIRDSYADESDELAKADAKSAKIQSDWRSGKLSPDAGKSPGAAPAAAKGNLAANQSEAYKSARESGLSDTAARALVANMTGEGLANPSTVNRDYNSRGEFVHMARGIVQWDPERSEAIKKQFGKYPNEMSVADQTKAAIWEMQNNPKYAKTWNSLQGDDPNQMINALVGNYERPANPAGDIAKRKGFYNALPKNLGSGDGTPLPADAQAKNSGAATHRVISDDITVHILDKNTGKPIAEPSKVPTRVQSNWNMG